MTFSDSFKCFHTADVFAALVHTSIWSRHVIVLKNLFCIFTYLAEHQNSFLYIFSAKQFQLPNIRCITTDNTSNSPGEVQTESETAGKGLIQDTQIRKHTTRQHEMTRLRLELETRTGNVECSIV